MKHFSLILPLALAALGLAMAAPDASAKAFKTGMVDPAVVCVNGLNNDSCNIYETGVSNTVDFQPCTSPLIPPGVNTAPPYPYCLWMYNATGSNLTTFDFHIPLPTGWGVGDTLECVTITASVGDPTLTPTAGCDQTFGAGSDGFFDISFTADTHIKPNAGFFLLMDFDGLLPSGPAGVVVGVPEPGVLGLFGFGLLALGVGFGLQRRRRTSAGNEAA